MQDSDENVKLATIHAQDVDIFPDEKTQTYYMIASGGGGVRAWTSKNLIDWQGPKTIFRTPPDIWGDIRTAGIWAPEMPRPPLPRAHCLATEGAFAPASPMLS